VLTLWSVAEGEGCLLHYFLQPMIGVHTTIADT